MTGPRPPTEPVREWVRERFDDDELIDAGVAALADEIVDRVEEKRRREERVFLYGDPEYEPEPDETDFDRIELENGSTIAVPPSDERTRAAAGWLEDHVRDALRPEPLIEPPDPEKSAEEIVDEIDELLEQVKRREYGPAFDAVATINGEPHRVTDVDVEWKGP